MRKSSTVLLIWLIFAGQLHAQPGYWQQQVSYTMAVDMDVKTNRFTGTQTLLEFRDGRAEMEYIPQYLMFGGKPVEDSGIPRVTYDPWKWTSPYYILTVNHPLKDLKDAEIDPSQRMADVNRVNNRVEFK